MIHVTPLVKADIYCNQKRLDHFVDLAKELQDEQPSISDIRVWYNRFDDYVKIDFELHGGYYSIAGYKVLALVKNGRSSDSRTFGGGAAKWDLIHFFKWNKHLDWHPRTQAQVWEEVEKILKSVRES